MASGAGIALQNLIFGRFINVITDFVAEISTPATFRHDVGKLAYVPAHPEWATCTDSPRLYFVYLGIARFFLSYTYNTLLTYTAYRIIRNIRHAYVKAALSQEIAYYDFGTGGSIAAQAAANGKLIQAGVAEKIGLLFQGISAFVTAFVIAFVVQWKLTLICLCIAPATVIVTGGVAAIEAGYETRILQLNAQANSFAEGVLAGVKAVNAFGMQASLVKKFDRYLTEAHQVGKKISLLFGILFSSEYCIVYLGFGLAFWQGIKRMVEGEISSPGDIFTVLLSVVIAAVNLTALAPYSIDFSRAASAAVQLFKLIDKQSAINPFSTSGLEPETVTGEIELNNINFAYPTRPGLSVLNDFSLYVPAGKVTALVGQSGSGKSTIIGLLERWYSPGSGTIRLDGVAIDQLNLNWLRKNVRLVQQEPVLFQGTVFENIKYGLVGSPWEHATREVQMEHVQEAAKIAYAHDFICELANGYDTYIGERGGLLSGGQKQRIAIARSIVSQPKVLLLDEATSALDPQAEGIVQKALDKASAGRTTITIAHKLATIRKADNIVVMSHGRVVEQGTHESLLAGDGVYARLVRIQDLKVKTSVSQNITENKEPTTENQSQSFTGATNTLTHYETTVRREMESLKERDNYDYHKQMGILNATGRLIRECPELKWAYLVTLLGCVAGAAVYPGQALLMARMVDVFQLPADRMMDRGSFFATMFIVLAAGCLVAYFAIGYATNTIAQHLSHWFRRQILWDMLRQDIQFFDRPENTVGALVTHVDSYPQAILELMGFNIALILISVLNLASCSILSIAHSWRLGLVVVFAGLPPLVGAGYAKIRLDARLDHMTSKRYSASSSIASEAVAAIRTVSSLAIEPIVLQRYTEELNIAVTASVKPMASTMVCFGLTQCIEYWFQALGFWYGCRLLSFGDISMYNFFVAFLGVFFSGQASSQVFQFSTSITKGVNAADYIFWLHKLQPTIRVTPENRDNSPVSSSSINFHHVKFSYPLRPDAPVLKGVNLKIERGQFVALVGASGCGKSTMIAMLERYYDPTTGTVTLDSSDLTTLNPACYRSIVGLVQQNPTLFDGTIRENIALGLSDDQPTFEVYKEGGLNLTTISDEAIEAALRSANAWDFVSSLPDGIYTPVGSGGTQLSGGQRQRITIARALIRNPKILLLDEATSALDTESERIVQKALEEAARANNRITVAVAHRLSTVRDADVICVFYGGRIAEVGTHQELFMQDGMYRKMCEAQALD
ncbi:P-loop containing nucleoside triphosphate hydrolase protein [Aspergillus pseudocaelatus]|uniref:P-loop containing nucleoside triphosphate hydrolase protein n=1 Tax=Aspergillus pseudocaelatus TaxID=1825620 RepID=A0ABQ6X2W1_9EURO|nr:P-loop containing nucleoside triphosphate hydrolase protein [Aspergillus pseudocaelatus]